MSCTALNDDSSLLPALLKLCEMLLLQPFPSGSGWTCRRLHDIRLSQATFGPNWYLADRLRILFNYNYAVPDEPTAGASEASVFGTRLNVHW